MQEMYSIAVIIDLLHKRKTKILYSHIEANTYDYNDTKFEKKTIVFAILHAPANEQNMYSIAIPIAPAINQTTKSKIRGKRLWLQWYELLKQK